MLGLEYDYLRKFMLIMWFCNFQIQWSDFRGVENVGVDRKINCK